MTTVTEPQARRVELWNVSGGAVLQATLRRNQDITGCGYLAGPMRGIDKFNFPVFMEMSQSLRARGLEVINPAEHDLITYPGMHDWPGFKKGNVDQCPEFDIQEAMRWDLRQITSVQHLFLLPNWSWSSGVQMELAVARACGLNIWEVSFDGEG